MAMQFCLVCKVAVYDNPAIPKDEGTYCDKCLDIKMKQAAKTAKKKGKNK